MAAAGIDLGTTHSCVSRVDGSTGEPVIIPNEAGEDPVRRLLRVGAQRAGRRRQPGPGVTHQGEPWGMSPYGC